MMKSLFCKNDQATLAKNSNLNKPILPFANDKSNTRKLKVISGQPPLRDELSRRQQLHLRGSTGKEYTDLAILLDQLKFDQDTNGTPCVPKKKVCAPMFYTMTGSYQLPTCRLLLLEWVRDSTVHTMIRLPIQPSPNLSEALSRASKR